MLSVDCVASGTPEKLKPLTSSRKHPTQSSRCSLLLRLSQEVINAKQNRPIQAPIQVPRSFTGWSGPVTENKPPGSGFVSCSLSRHDCGGGLSSSQGSADHPACTGTLCYGEARVLLADVTALICDALLSASFDRICLRNISLLLPAHRIQNPEHRERALPSQLPKIVRLHTGEG